MKAGVRSLKNISMLFTLNRDELGNYCLGLKTCLNMSWCLVHNIMSWFSQSSRARAFKKGKNKLLVSELISSRGIFVISTHN